MNVKNRQEYVDELTENLLDVLREARIEYEPMEVVNAGLRFSQYAIRYVMRHSDGHEARIVNQRVMLDALDVLKLDTLTASDQRRVN